MTLHNALYFNNPLNYDVGRIKRHGTSVIINEMSDNSYLTFSTESDVAVNLADSLGNPTKITHIFIKYKGDLTSYIGTPTGGIGSAFSRTLPTEILNYEDATVSLEVNGFKHDLYELPSAVSATDVRMQFTATNLEIYALMLLELGYEIDANCQFTQIEYNHTDRAGSSSQNPQGRSVRDPSYAGARVKGEARYTAIFRSAEVPVFLDWMERHLNFAFAREFSRYPADVFLATFPDLRVQNEYLNNVMESLGFRVAER